MGDKSLLTAQEKLKLAELRNIAAQNYNELTQEQIDKMDELQDKEKGLVDSSERRIESLIKANELLAIQIERNEILIGQGETVVGQYELKLQQQQNALELEKEQLDISAENYEKELGILNAQIKALDAKKKGYADSEGFAKRFLGITREPASGIGKFLVDPTSYTQGMVSGLGEVVDGMSIMTSTIDKVVEATVALAIEQDAAISGFRKATGATGEFDADIVKLERDLYRAGVTSAEAAESVQQLYLNVSGFTEMGDTAREEMEGMVAVLAEVGVAASDSTQNIQTAIKGLGMSNTEATMLQSELRSFAQGINVSVGQLSKDFNTMGPQIVAMGDKGVAAFESLQVTMKETGLEMATVLKLVEQFDTFDGAATQVGKLNALMGGPFLNTLELVSETDLGARMEKLRDGVMDAGVSFDSLDYYQKKAYTSALGLNSEMELAMFLGNNMDSIIPEEKTAEEYEKIAKENAEFNTVMEEAIQAGKSLAISLRWVVTSLKWFFEIVAEIGPAITAAALAIGIMRTALSLATWATKVHTAAQKDNIAISKGAALWDKVEAGWKYAKATAYNWLTGATIANTGATEANRIAWWKLGAAFIAIGGLLYVAIASPGLITIIGLLTFAMFGLLFATNVLGWSMAPVIPVLYAFGGAVFLIGLGIGIAAAAMALFVSSISAIGTGLAVSMLATALAIRQIVDAIEDIPMTKTLALTAAILPLAAMAPIAMVAAAGVGAATRGAGGASSAGATGPAGPGPVIKLYLDVDGDKFAAAVNRVEVGNKVTSRLHQTFVDQLASALGPTKS